MKKIYILLIFSAISVTLFGQSDIVTAGGTATGAGGSATYTVGQIAVQRATDGSKYIIEGVQQPYEIQAVGVDDYPQIVLDAVVYPNPTENQARLQLNGFELTDDGLQAHLFDSRGRLLQVIPVTGDLTTFQIGQYATGTYFLELRDGKRTLKTFKVVRK